MKTSKEWWEETKADPAKLTDWLQRQYTGEVTAANRIIDFMKQYATNDRERHILAFIANQERLHAKWIKQCLLNRGIDPEVGESDKKYWKETMPGITDFQTGAAVAYYAEKMRLERIRVIAEDRTAPWDVRDVFYRILPDEEGHEKMFYKLTNVQALEAALNNHEQGMETLGLVI